MLYGMASMYKGRPTSVVEHVKKPAQYIYHLVRLPSTTFDTRGSVNIFFFSESLQMRLASISSVSPLIIRYCFAITPKLQEAKRSIYVHVLQGPEVAPINIPPAQHSLLLQALLDPFDNLPCGVLVAIRVEFCLIIQDLRTVIWTLSTQLEFPVIRRNDPGE